MTARKPDLYRELAEQLRGLLAGETDRTANAANMAALIYHGLPDINWAGFLFSSRSGAGARAVPGQAGLRTDPARQGRLRRRGVTGRDGSGPRRARFPGPYRLRSDFTLRAGRAAAPRPRGNGRGGPRRARPQQPAARPL